MKKVIFIVLVTVMAVGAKAQDCRAIVLPMFRYDTARLDQYPADKLEYRCHFSQASFYESDTVPQGVDVYNISEVRETYGTVHLPQNYVVDLSALSYYAYNFVEFQYRYPTTETTICFSTPSSTHPYLVLRSIEDAKRMADEWLATYYRSLGY